MMVPLVLGLSACYPTRFALYQFADIRDHRKFPAAPVAADSQAHPLPLAQADSVHLPATIPVKGRKLPWAEALEASRTVAFLVLRGDSVLYESYHQGYDAQSVVPSFSVAKSYVGALVGISLARGELPGLDAPIAPYFPESDSAELAGITLAHLLYMQSGLAFKESYYNPFASDVGRYYYGGNVNRLIRRVKSDPDCPPGQRFRYISLDTQLLGEILEQATGQPLNVLLSQRLWQPLGCLQAATWSMDSRRHRQIKAFAGLNATARDFARLGVLYLQAGRWQGQQIVPRAWVEETAGTCKGCKRYGYAHQWWQEGETSFAAEGHLGQYVSVHPESGLVMVRLGKKYGGVQWEQLFQQIADQNVPSAMTPR
jgi:CubicO group peptidase (beta-lactamase class C family)